MSATTIRPTWDNQRIKRDRIALLQAEMKRQGVGALYLNDGIGQRYVLNVKVPGTKVFVPVEGEPIAFVRPRDEGYVAAQHPNIRPPLSRAPAGVTSESNANSPFARGLTALLAEHGVAGEKLAVDTMALGQVLDLVKAGINLVEAGPILERTWTVK